MKAAEVFNAGYTLANLVQNTDQWLAWREIGMGASDAPTVMGENPWKTPYQLWAEKVGLRAKPDLSGNPNVQRGNKYEDEARAAWEAANASFAMPLCAVNNSASWLRVSYDGIAGEVNLEIKCPGQKKLSRLRDIVGDSKEVWINKRSDLEKLGFGHYWAQVQYQMVVAGLPKTALWLYNTEKAVGIQVNIDFDEAYCDKLLATMEAFWNGIKALNPPELNPEKDVFSVEDFDAERQKDWHDAKGRYIDLEAEIKANEAIVKELKADRKIAQEDLALVAGEWPRVIDDDGFKLSSFSKRGSVDYAKAINALAPQITAADLDAFRRRASTGVKITIPKG